MAKFYSLAFVSLLLLAFGSCQSLEQISIDYMQPGDMTFPSQLRKVAIVNNTSTEPDNKLITQTEKPKENVPEISHATAYANGNVKIAAESLAEEIKSEIEKFSELVTPAIIFNSGELKGNTGAGVKGVKDSVEKGNWLRYCFWKIYLNRKGQNMEYSKGVIRKVAGPLVIADGMRDANMFDVVRVSDKELIGEIIEMHGDQASIQVYEETAGLVPVNL